jgi:heme/copper-type cytochrome/quinol oxidase subunit 2
MQHDTLSYDSLINRPLPKWLIDQKSGLTTIQPQKIVIREDNSLKISFFLTSVFILLTVIILTVYFTKRYKKHM